MPHGVGSSQPRASLLQLLVIEEGPMSGNRQGFYSWKMLGSDYYGITHLSRGVDKFGESWGWAGMHVGSERKRSCAKNA